MPAKVTLNNKYVLTEDIDNCYLWCDLVILGLAFSSEQKSSVLHISCTIYLQWLTRSLTRKMCQTVSKNILNIHGYIYII